MTCHDCHGPVPNDDPDVERHGDNWTCGDCTVNDSRLRPVTVTVDRIIAYEQGELSSDEALQLIADLVRSGQVWHLQGSYGRFAAQLIMAGRITEHGEIVEVDD